MFFIVDYSGFTFSLNEGEGEKVEKVGDSVFRNQ